MKSQQGHSTLEWLLITTVLIMALVTILYRSAAVIALFGKFHERLSQRVAENPFDNSI